MPWKTKRLLILMACGFFALGLAVLVLVRNTDRAFNDASLLAYIGIFGGVAIIITNLPDE